MPHGAGKWRETHYGPQAKAFMQKQAKQNRHQAKGNRALFGTRQKPPCRTNQSIMQMKQKPNDVLTKASCGLDKSIVAFKAKLNDVRPKAS